jgi:hypothetical protein
MVSIPFKAAATGRICMKICAENLLSKHKQAIQNSNKTNIQKAMDNDNKRASTLISAMVKDNKTFAEITKLYRCNGIMKNTVPNQNKYLLYFLQQFRWCKHLYFF